MRSVSNTLEVASAFELSPLLLTMYGNERGLHLVRTRREPGLDVEIDARQQWVALLSRPDHLAKSYRGCTVEGRSYSSTLQTPRGSHTTAIPIFCALSCELILSSGEPNLRPQCACSETNLIQCGQCSKLGGDSHVQSCSVMV